MPQGSGHKNSKAWSGYQFPAEKNVQGGGGRGLNVRGGGAKCGGGAKFHIVQINKKGCLQEIGKHPPIAKHNKIIDIIF